MISIMSNSSINKNDPPNLSANKDIPLQSNLNTSSTLGSTSTTTTTSSNYSNSNANNINTNGYNNNRMYINSNSCLNSLESAQLKKLKKSRYSLNQQEQEQEQLTHLLKSSKPERISPALLLTPSPPLPPLLMSSKMMTNNSGYLKQEYDSNSNSNSPSLSSTNSTGSAVNFGDQRTMDAADTLVSLAHSASSTPTIESKSFADAVSPDASLTNASQQKNDINNNNIEIIVNTSNDDSLDKSSNDETFKSNKEIVESACKLLIQQVLKSCPSINLSSITIKTTSSPVTKQSTAPKSSNSAPTPVDTSTNLSTEITKASTIQLKTATCENEETKFNGNSHRLDKQENLAKKENSLNTTSVSPNRQNLSFDSKFLSQHHFSTSNFANHNQDSINVQHMKASNDLKNNLLNLKTVSQLFSPTTGPPKSMSAESAAFAASMKFSSDLTSPSRNPLIFPNRKLSNMYYQSSSDCISSPTTTSYDFTKFSQSNDSFSSTNTNSHASLTNKKNLKRKLEIDTGEQNFSSMNDLNKSISSINTISDNEEDSFNGYDDEEEDRLNEKENERSFSSDSLSNGFFTNQNQSRNRSKSPTNSLGLNTSFSLRPAPTLATGRKSKDTTLPPDEARKRQDRRERNKEAAARCRRKREDLTMSLTRKTEELSREADHLKRKYQELNNEKMRLENLLSSHEKTCSSSSPKSNTNATSNAISNNTIVANSNFLQQQQQQQQYQQQQLLKIKKEEIDDIIKQSQDRKTQKIINQLNNFNNINNANNNFNMSPTQSGKMMNGHLNLDSNQQTNKTPSHCSTLQEAFNNTYNEKHHFMSNPNSNSFHNHHLNTYHHSQTTAIVTPNSATQLENLLSHFEMAKKSPSSDVSHTSSFSPPPLSMPQSNGKSPTFLQRPNNLSLKHQQQSNFPNSTSSPNSLALMQNIAYNIFNAASSTTSQHNPIFNSTNLNLLMTPTLQLNTPTLYAITPIDSNLYNSSFNNCNTPVIQTSQQFMQNQSLNGYIPIVTQNQSNNKNNNSETNTTNIKT